HHRKRPINFFAAGTPAFRHGEEPRLRLQEKRKNRNRRVSRRGRMNDRKVPTCGRAGPPKGWARILSSGLRGRLRSRRIVGLGAASSGPDWRSIRDVLSVARFASALVPKHQSPLVNTCVRLALLQAPSFSYGVVDTFLASGLQYFQPARLLPLNSGFQP